MKAFQECPSQLGIALTLAYEEAGSRVCSDRKAWTRLSHTLGMLRGWLEPVAIKRFLSAMTDVVGTFFRSEHVPCAPHENPRRRFGGSPQQFFGFGEFHLDRLEIGAVGRQE